MEVGPTHLHHQVNVVVLLGAGQQCDDVFVMQRTQLPQNLDFLAEQTLRFGEAFLRDAFNRNGEKFLEKNKEKKRGVRDEYIIISHS